MWHKAKPDSRILTWRHFRNSLGEFPDALDSIANEWGNVPVKSHYLDPDPDTWPSIWELISENEYCEIAISLGMAYTILYSNKPHEEFELLGLNCRRQNQNYYIVSYDSGKYVLNYDHKSVINISSMPTDVELLYRVPYNNLTRYKEKNDI